MRSVKEAKSNNKSTKTHPKPKRKPLFYAVIAPKVC